MSLAQVEAAVRQLQGRWRLTHHVAVHLLRFVGAMGGRTTSGGRTPDENHAAGGAPRSDHLWGGAFDVVPARARWESARRFLEQDRCGPECRGARIVIDEHDHLHASYWT